MQNKLNVYSTYIVVITKPLLLKIIRLLSSSFTIITCIQYIALLNCASSIVYNSKNNLIYYHTLTVSSFVSSLICWVSFVTLNRFKVDLYDFSTHHIYLLISKISHVIWGADGLFGSWIWSEKVVKVIKQIEYTVI